MTTTIVAIFLIVYLGMLLGELPFLQVDRTGVALLGAIAMVSFDAVSLEEAADAVHLPTIILLFRSWCSPRRCVLAVSTTG